MGLTLKPVPYVAGVAGWAIGRLALKLRKRLQPVLQIKRNRPQGRFFYG